MAALFILYDHAAKILTNGTVNYLTDDLYVAMMTGSFTGDSTRTIWANVSANEVAAGNGYTTGGFLLEGKTITNASMDGVIASPSLTKEFKALVIYKLGTANGFVNPLLGYIDFTTSIILTAEVFTTAFYSGLIPFTTNRLF